MRIGLSLRDKKTGNAAWQYFLPLFSVMTAEQAEKSGLCENCEWAYYAHPIVFPEGTKLCTKAFKASYMPGLEMQDCA